MRVAIIGSRTLIVEDISIYIPEGITEIVSGGAKGIDTQVEAYADKHHIPKLIFKPEYVKYGKQAPLIRNREMVKIVDSVVAIWDGKSRGTKFTIDYAHSLCVPVSVHIIN